jgi:hypothetical protein
LPARPDFTSQGILSFADNLDLSDAGPPKRFERVVYMRHLAVEFSAIN